ncbi:chorion peroxidase-like [Pollicipes pollicipes]|uniref:chorion peroxidase-like n=1 Tax=Pollicipes pollicipes TaxID=41117 RepID=UPI0018859357|nr:chorion peroxidase-like [Pollicipes pollicipes]
MAGQPLLRLLPSRQAVTRSEDVPDARFTLSVMQWGQFVDHDLMLTPHFSLDGGAGIACCTDACMDFVRSLPAPAPTCGATRDAQQQNVLSHFLDGSNVYGSEEAHQRHLRQLGGGWLRTQPGSLLPADSQGGGCINAITVCFEAGDVRVNEQISLTVTHTIWMRQHNRVASALAARHTTWDDERLFQEARRIVVAQMQHITYNEWLPTLLDADFLTRNELLPGTGTAHSEKYMSTLNPSISNEFATAAFRFGHSMVSGTLKMFSALGGSATSVLLRDFFFDPHLLYSSERLNELARGLVAQQAQALDGYFAEDLTEHLFQGDGDAYGLDLVALNIQRGRDHGLATYNDARAAAGLPRAQRWEDLSSDLPDEAITVLRAAYGHVDDVDMFVGGVLERPLPGVALGRTFGRLIGDQFIRLRHGDNFFYDLGGDRPWQLTGAQLAQVRRTSWARVLCDNVDGITRVQPLAFRVADTAANAVTDCDSRAIPTVDLSQW